MVEIAELLKQIEAYCAKNEIEETTFGFRAVNDGKFVARIRDGKSITIKTYRKAIDFMKRKPVKVAA